jgi:cyclopropane fatty-acyl-phospholipid synthase-like methyltransferase
MQAMSSVNLQSEAVNYWNDPIGSIKENSHILGSGKWGSRDKWQAIGDGHLKMFLNFDCKKGSMIEWGCGGGSNALAFSKIFDKVTGIDISKQSLKACDVLEIDNFEGVLLDVEVSGQYDFFLSTATFQHFTSKEYGENIVKKAHDILKPNALAMIQTRYDNGDERFIQKYKDYKNNAITFTSYKIDEFWGLLDDSGFDVESVILEPQANYAYYFARVK